MNKVPDFSKLSPIYDFLGSLVFWGALHKSQIHFLNETSQAKNCLILGGGTGCFLLDLLNENEEIQVTYVDISPGMISRAKKKVARIGKSDQVKFICGDLCDFPNGKFDLLCTHYFLDCFSEAELVDVMKKSSSHLKSGGIWHFTDFYLHEKSSYFRKKFVGFLYWFFRMTCGLQVKKLPDFEKLFERQGMQLESEKYFRNGLLRTALYSSIKD